MNFDMKRYKTWDWGVLGVFVLTIIGVSIPWWHFKTGDILGGALGTSALSVNASGWSTGVIGTGKASFALVLIALLVVVVKALFKGPTPSWYKESWVMMGFGGLLTILGIVGTADAPIGGFSAWGWRPGSLITLIAAVALLGIGYMMFKDKTGAYDGQGKIQMPNISMGGQNPPPGNPPTA